MKRLTNLKLLPFLEIFIANLILVLISNCMVKKIINLITTNYENAIYLIIFLNIILVLILSVVNIIGYLLNYVFIKLLFIGTTFKENIKELNFISIMGLKSFISSCILLIVFGISDYFFNETYLQNNWTYICNCFVMIINIITLIIFGIYIQMKIKSISKIKSIAYTLVPYTIYNLSIYMIKFII